LFESDQKAHAYEREDDGEAERGRVIPFLERAINESRRGIRASCNRSTKHEDSAELA
jgi:hypothetical protein